jgi:hypothetical protein
MDYLTTVTLLVITTLLSAVIIILIPTLLINYIINKIAKTNSILQRIIITSIVALILLLLFRINFLYLFFGYLIAIIVFAISPIYMKTEAFQKIQKYKRIIQIFSGILLLTTFIFSMFLLFIGSELAWDSHMFQSAIFLVAGIALLKNDFRPSKFFAWLIPYPMIYSIFFYHDSSFASISDWLFGIEFFTGHEGGMNSIAEFFNNTLGWSYPSYKLFDFLAPSAFTTSLWCIILAIVISKIERVTSAHLNFLNNDQR